MSFYEIWEHYQYGTTAERFVKLHFVNNRKQELVRRELPKSHGISYKFARDLRIKEFGDEMGLELMTKNPQIEYSKLVEMTKEIQE